MTRATTRLFLLPALAFALQACSGPIWWASKKVVKEEAREIGEKTNIISSKEDLKREIEEGKKECEAKKEEIRSGCKEREEKLEQRLKELQEKYDQREKELLKKLEGK